MESTVRQKYINLVFAGGSPDVAYLHDSDFTIEEYEQALGTDEYKEFADKVQTEFLSKIDLLLMGNLFRLQEALSLINPTEKNYPQIYKNYTELLKLTAPIIERLNKQKLEVNKLDGLELVIKGVD